MKEKILDDWFVVEGSCGLSKRLSAVASEIQTFTGSLAFKRWRQRDAQVSPDGLRLDLVYEREDHRRVMLEGRGILDSMLQGFAQDHKTWQRSLGYEFRLELHFCQGVFGGASMSFKLEEKIDSLGHEFNHGHFKGPSFIGEIQQDLQELFSRLQSSREW